MPTPTDRRVNELNHALYVAQNVAERQAELIQQLWRVVQSQAKRLEMVSLLLNELIKEYGFIAGGSGTRSDSKEFAARSLVIGECPDKSVWFQIDNDGHWFTMERRLSGLLDFLASEPDEEIRSDKLTGFRSRSAILAYLESTGGRKYDAQYVNKLVKKLRDRLGEYGIHTFVVSSDRDGVRILVRRDGICHVQLEHRPSNNGTNARLSKQ